MKNLETSKPVSKKSQIIKLEVKKGQMMKLVSSDLR